MTLARLDPLKRSPSTQPLMPAIFWQLLHCQNDQPSPPQLAPGRIGSAAFVQWAIQSRCPAAATTGESPSFVFQKLGET